MISTASGPQAQSIFIESLSCCRTSDLPQGRERKEGERDASSLVVEQWQKACDRPFGGTLCLSVGLLDRVVGLERVGARAAMSISKSRKSLVRPTVRRRTRDNRKWTFFASSKRFLVAIECDVYLMAQLDYTLWHHRFSIKNVRLPCTATHTPSILIFQPAGK